MPNVNHQNIKELINALQEISDRAAGEVPFSRMDLALIKEKALRIYELSEKKEPVKLPEEEKENALRPLKEEANRELEEIKKISRELTTTLSLAREELKRIRETPRPENTPVPKAPDKPPVETPSEPVEQKSPEIPLWKPPTKEEPVRQEQKEEQKPREKEIPREEEPEIKSPVEEPTENKPSTSGPATTEKPEEPRRSLYERLGGKKPSLHERLSSSNKGRVMDRMSQKPIDDIKTAISLNQRISFIKTLFEGNEKEYRKTLEFINRSSNYSEAKFYINSHIRNKYMWKEEDDNVQEFMNLVYRKFL